MLRRVRRWWGDRNLDIDGEGLDAPSEALPPSWVDASEATDCGVRDAVNAIELDVVTAMRRLTGGLAQAERFSEHCEASSRTIQDRVAEVRAATFTAASNSVALATATQQVSNSAEQVGSAMGNAQDRLDAAATRAVEATQMMTGLAIATVEIRGIVDSIAEIARQTNLLALNATIEAARAGDAGRGFGIVAIEVKELSVEVRDSVEHIRRRVEHLALAAQGSASIVNDALRMVRDVNPVIAAIGDASREQATAAAELSRSAQETARYVETVLHRVEEIDRVALSAAGESANVRRALSDVARQAGSMLRRFIPTLRHAAFADRRRHDRFPADYGVELRLGTLVMASRTIDIGLGGVLVAGVPDERLRPGMEGRIAVAGLPDLACRLLAVSDLGLHLAFDAGARDAGLQALIRDIEQSYLPLVQRALSFSDAVRAVMENALATGLLTEADLFDVDYIDVEGSQPPQYLNRALGTLEELLPPLFAATMSGDERLVFAIAIDRNGYVPVHQPDVSLPQRPGETQWNIGHSRNRRIFDDRAGIMAARSVRPFLVQSYRRELGGDVVQFVREVDAPLRVRGRHWGGVRMAYRM